MPARQVCSAAVEEQRERPELAEVFCHESDDRPIGVEVEPFNASMAYERTGTSSIGTIAQIQIPGVRWDTNEPPREKSPERRLFCRPRARQFLFPPPKP